MDHLTLCLYSVHADRRQLPPTPPSEDEESEEEEEENCLPDVPRRTCSRQSSHDSSADPSDSGSGTELQSTHATLML